jgi:gluconokinase
MSSVLDEVLEGYEPAPELVSLMAGSKTAAVLALDIGTSGVRASLFDESGLELDGETIRTRHTFSRIGDLAVTDADVIFDLVTETIDTLFSRPYHAASQIQLIAISCFWHSLMGVNAEGCATTPVFTWADTRAAGTIKELQSRFDEMAVHSRTGCRFHPSYWPAKLLWLRSTDPQTVDKTNCWLSFGEYVVLRLSGQTEASVSMASGTGLFNQRLLQWDRELCEGLSIPGSNLPDISSTGQACGQLRIEYVARWPMLGEARISPPIGDGAANAIGSGCTTRERIALMIGTSAAMRVLYEGEPPSELPKSLWCYRADRDRVVVGGALSDGGSLHHWIKEMLLLDGGSEALEAALEELEPDAHGLTVLPFWGGERSTGWSPNARGAILGLTLHTETLEILRAAMEGIAYRFALIARDLDPVAPAASIIASGTALRSSPAWTQIIADVLGRSLLVSETQEASARGAALLALEAAGKIQSITDLPVGVRRTCEPNMSRHLIYQKALERQQQIYERVIGPN